MHRIVTRSLAAAALVGALLASTATAVSALAATPTPAPAAAVSVHFARVVRTVTPAGARFFGLKATVTGGGTGVDRAITAGVQHHLDALATSYATRAADAEQAGSPADAVFDTVGGSVARSAHYLTVVLTESVDLGGAHPGYLTHAYVFDARTGREITVASLFRNPARANALMRSAMVASNRRVGITAHDVRLLSIVPRFGDASTWPLSCCPLRVGLDCVVDPGGASPFAAGQLHTTVSWTALSGS